jgi:hypothetical protein
MVQYWIRLRICRSKCNGCFFFKFGVEVGVEESIVNAPRDYNSDQLFKSNLTFCVVCVLRMNWSNNLSKKLRNSYNAMKRLLREINI